jgi:Peptidase A4 family
VSTSEDALGVRLPFELSPTSLEGVFTTNAPAKGFDPRTASDASLIKNGLMWRRPTVEDPLAVRALWDRVMSRDWSAAERIVPEFEVQTGKTHNLRRATKQADGSYTSYNWSGAVLPGTWAGVLGTWEIPTVSPAPERPEGGGWDSASWVGLDGFFGSEDVLQAGVEQFVSTTGQASYAAWYEWFVNDPPLHPPPPPYVKQMNIPNFPVSPGQTVDVSVQYVNGAGYINFLNATTGQRFSITLAPPPGATMSGNTAEWIMEVPNGGEGTVSLPKFTPVVFGPAFSCPPNNDMPIGNGGTGDIFNIIEGLGTRLTSVTLDSLEHEVTIDFTG